MKAGHVERVDLDSDASISEDGTKELKNFGLPKKIISKHAKNKMIMKLPYHEFHNRIVKRKIEEAKFMQAPDAPIRSASTLVTKDTKLDASEDWLVKKDPVIAAAEQSNGFMSSRHLS